jgi:hypothetical protein
MDLDPWRKDFRSLMRDTTSSSSHPSEEQWVRFAADHLPPDERNRLADHVLTCAECTAVYRAVSQVRERASEFDQGAPSRPR